jgi:membrane protein DedA with SNARE-associated domain
MSLEHLIETYGYGVILIGTFMEGETVLMLGGIAAKLGYLHLPWVVIAAFAGSFLGDQLYFFLGRRHGKALMDRRPQWQPAAQRVYDLLDRYRMLFVVGFRFVYGLRTVSPFVIGMSRIPTVEFFLLNLTGALLWASGIGALAFSFGHALEAALGHVRRYEVGVMTLLAGLAALMWLARAYRRRYMRSTARDPEHFVE